MAVLTVFAMVLVVLGHCDITPDYKELWHFKWIYSFHMPLFFFISGFLFCLTNPAERLRITSYRAFLKKKTVRLLVPFLFINTVIFLVKAVLIKDPSIMQHPTSLTWDSFIYYTLFAPIGFMWFLPALFVIFALVFPFWKFLRCKFERGGVFLLPIFLLLIVTGRIFTSVTFLQIGSAIHYMPYFIAGMAYCCYKPVVDGCLTKWRKVLIPVFFVLSVSLLTQGMVAAFCGISFSLCWTLAVADGISDWIMKLSGYCYSVFLLSYFPQMFIRGPVAYGFPDINQYVFSSFSFMLGLSIPLCICLLYDRLKSRYAFLRYSGILIGL